MKPGETGNKPGTRKRIRGELEPPKIAIPFRWALKNCERNGMQAVTRARDTCVRAGDKAGGAVHPEAVGCDLQGASPRTGRDKGKGANASEALSCGDGGRALRG